LGPDPDGEERAVPPSARGDEREERRVAPGDEDEDGGVIEAAHPLARGDVPADAVVEGARAKEEREARAEDKRGEDGAAPLCPHDEHAARGDRDEERDLVGYAAKERSVGGRRAVGEDGHGARPV